MKSKSIQWLLFFPICAAIVLCIGVFIGRSAGAVSGSGNASPTTLPAMGDLARKRYDIAQQGLQAAIYGRRPGQALGQVALGWLQLRAKAFHDLALPRAQRLAFVEEYVHQLVDQEEFEERLNKQQLTGSDFVLRARYDRLEAQMWLVQVRAEND